MSPGPSLPWRQRPAAEWLRLYFVLDLQTASRDPRGLAAAALAGRVTALQLRAKQGPDADLHSLSLDLQQLCRQAGVPFILNDRVDLARAVGADGVHVGAEDLPPAEARALLGPEAVIGVSVRSMAEAASVDPAIADYAGIYPVYQTSTKPDVPPPLSFLALADLVQAVRVPSVGIGGISAGTVRPVIRAGAAGIAVVSAIGAALDPESAALGLRAEVEAALSERPRP